MNVTITGGFGFIGSHLTEILLNKGHSIHVVDNLSTGAPDNIDERDVDVSIMDLCDPKNNREFELIVKDSDIIYHLASPVGVKYIDRDPHNSITRSYQLIMNTIPIISKYKRRTIYASTSEVYGETVNANETDNLVIGCPDVLRWGYACSKLSGEFLLKSYDVPGTVVRFFNVVGPRQRGDTGMVIPKFIQSAINSQDIIVYGDGTQHRCFCDIRDALNMMSVVSTDDHINQTYNIGNNHNLLNINDLAKMIVEKTSSQSRIIHKEYNADYSVNSKDIINRSPDTTKINRYYKPVHDINSIIDNIIRELPHVTNK